MASTPATASKQGALPSPPLPPGLRPVRRATLLAAALILGAAPALAAEPPVPDSPAARSAGRTVYAAHCAVCHGDAGAGAGALRGGLSVPPPPLGPLVARHSSRWLYVRITQGWGQMHAFGHTLSVTERWRLVHHLRSLADAHSR